MAEEQVGQAKVQPEDPEYLLEEHVAYKRKLQVGTQQLRKLLQQNLSQFAPVMNGQTFSYTKLQLANKGIGAVGELIGEYPHLRRIDLSTNLLTEISQIQKLRYLTDLDLSRNRLSEAKFLSNSHLFPFLYALNLANNQLSYLPSIQIPALRRLNLNSNRISSVEDFDGHSNIQILELRSNLIQSLHNLQRLPALKALYLADNHITSVVGLKNVPQLERLHLRKNKIVDLVGFQARIPVVYLNLRENQVAKVDNLIGVTQSVKVVNLLANPISEELGDNTKKEVWMKFRQFTRINKNDVTTEEKEQFDKEYRDRLAQQERQRLEKQAAEREAREQAEREAAQKEQ